jgi:GDPmannose 4,6-dehydratase
VARTALITGAAGQDGSYLAELLLGKGYRVVGMDQRSPSDYLENIEHIKERITLLHADLIDQAALMDLVDRTQPDEIYNLAAQSFIPLSWDEPVLTGELNALGVTRLLEAIRRIKPDVRFYQASSSEMFGKPDTKPQDEHTSFQPGTPYGTAKLYGHWITANYRSKLGLYACSGILYNHESPRRGRDFVTRKIALAAARIKCGLQHTVALGSLDAQRDWGYAFDYVNAMWLMLQQDEPGDYVIATGEEHSVRDIVRVAFDHVGLDWQEHVEIDQRLFRPVELNRLVGNPAKAERILGWQRSSTFDALIKLMVDADLAHIEHGDKTVS